MLCIQNLFFKVKLVKSRIYNYLTHLYHRITTDENENYRNSDMCTHKSYSTIGNKFNNYLTSKYIYSCSYKLKYSIFYNNILGKGSSGEVYRAINIYNKHYYAVKIIDVIALKYQHLSRLNREINILYDLSHPNIIKINNVYLNEGKIYLFQELCEGGDLFDYRNYVKTYNLNYETICKNIIYTLVKCLEYIHSKGVIHRDLKLENVMFNRYNNCYDTVKIIDFGLATYYKSTPEHSRLGTQLYVSPEVINGSYTKTCDIWSIGIITYILLCGSHPFIAKTKNKIFYKIKDLQYSFPDKLWYGISIDAINLITNILKYENDRYSISEIINHKWFDDIRK